MKHSSIVLMIVLSGICIQSFSQEIDDSLTDDAHTLILDSDITFRIISPKSAVSIVKKSILILNNKSRYNKLYLHYDNFSKIKGIHGTISTLNGNVIRKIGKSEIEDYSAVSDFSIYEDSRVKFVEVAHNSYPYVFTFEYIKEYSGIFDYENWHPQYSSGVGVKQSSFTVIIPADMNLRYKQVNIDKEPSIEKGKENTSYNWKISNLKPMKEEPYSPNETDYLPYVLTAPSDFEIDGYKGDMSTWKSYGDFIHKLNEDGGTLSYALETKVKELTSHLSSSNEKIAALYNYVQENTRYVSVQLGIGGWKSFPVDYVEENKFGDCKALTYFTKALLDVVDIEAYPALIYSGRAAETHFDDFTEPGFNHVILYMPKEDSWLECTSNNNPANYLGSSNQNRRALLIRPGNSELINTPAPTAAENKQLQNISVTLQPTGAAQITYNQQAFGIQHDRLRYLEEIAKEDQEDWLYENIDLSGFDLKSFHITSAPHQPEAALKLEMAVSKLASVSGERLFFYPNVLNRTVSTPKKIEDRRFPVHRQNAFLNEDVVTITLPDGYTIENQPKNLVLETEFGTFKMDITVVENQMVYKRIFKSNSFLFPADRYKDLRAFYKQISKSDKEKVVLVKTK